MEVVLDSPVTVLLDLDCVRQGEDTHVGLRQDGVVSCLLGERGDWTKVKDTQLVSDCRGLRTAFSKAKAEG